LIVQIYAPLTDEQVRGREEYDRVLYIWGCPRKKCAKRSIKAVRALKKNAEWADKLAKRRKNEDEAKAQQQQRSKEASAASNLNPFSVRAIFPV
jgi:hypothetical protein